MQGKLLYFNLHSTPLTYPYPEPLSPLKNVKYPRFWRHGFVHIPQKKNKKFS